MVRTSPHVLIRSSGPVEYDFILTDQSFSSPGILQMFMLMRSASSATFVLKVLVSNLTSMPTCRRCMVLNYLVNFVEKYCLMWKACEATFCHCIKETSAALNAKFVKRSFRETPTWYDMSPMFINMMVVVKLYTVLNVETIPQHRFDTK